MAWRRDFFQRDYDIAIALMDDPATLFNPVFTAWGRRPLDA